MLETARIGEKRSEAFSQGTANGGIMILGCIDGGLLCGPIALGVYGCSVLGIGAWLKARVCSCKEPQSVEGEGSDKAVDTED
jgi:hypothetical protein